jgi:hypothetical protein
MVVMCVRNPPTFAPSPLRGAWGLVATQPSAGYPGAALLRRRRPGTQRRRWVRARRAVGGVSPRIRMR